MITKRCIRVLAGGTTYSYHLHTNKIITPSICTRIDNATRYCPLSSVSTGHINVRYNNVIYKAIDITPNAQITYDVTASTEEYQTGYVFNRFRITMLNDCTINNVIDIQLRLGTSTWSTVLSLPSGGIFTNMTAGSLYNSYVCRLKIGSWTSSEYNVLGVGSKTITIPEAQWGV